MFVLEEPKSRKRRRASQEPTDIKQAPAAKKQKSFPESPIQPYHRPPSFWDTLSKIRLSRSSLSEFDRRNIQETCQPDPIQTQVVKYPTGRARQRLKRFARRGGPDLSHLRGLANSPLLVNDAMSHSTSSRSRKRSSTSAPSDLTKTSKTTPYSGNFEQKMIDNGIYPDEFEHPDGRLQPDPANLDDIQGELLTVRASLSPSRFTDADFKAFKRENAKASGETTALYKVLPFITGKETGHHRSEADLPFSNLEPFDKDLSDAKPDVHYGAPPSTIDKRVRNDLGKYIIPTTTTSRPAAPNFFVEGKSAQGRGDVAKRQALHDGAVGARAIHKLQNYGANEPVYDNNAYSFSSTYHAGHLQIYATHPTQPTVPGTKPEYHMTQLNSYAMTGNINSFRQGATAYRNTRDLAKTQRDGFIDKANRIAREMPTPSPTTTFTDSRTSRPTPLARRSDTSEDELAHDEATPVKRLRPAPGSQSHKGRQSTEQNTTARSDPLKSSATDTSSRGRLSDSTTPSSRQ